MWALSAARIVVSATPQTVTAVEDSAILVDGSTIHSVLSRAAIPHGIPHIQAGAALITPGLIDAHTHAAWAGSRHDEYAIRMAGGDYEAIARAGGGILSTQRAIASSTEAELTDIVRARLLRMASMGLTTVEVKSGYGLDPENELKQLRVLATLRTDPRLPRIVPTFLALHALPVDARDRRESYVESVIRDLLPRVARDGLATFVDAYLDRNAFTIDEGRALGQAAKAHNLRVRLHVGQFADIGGAELAAELNAASADHLEFVGPAGIDALANAPVFAGLLPIACFTLKQSPPPIALMRERGVAFVVASDANPGTAPTESLPLAMSLASRLFGLTPAEILAGVTQNAASSLALTNVGVLRPGAAADFVAWDLPHEHALLQPWGTPKAVASMRDGRPLIDPCGLFGALSLSPK